MLSKDENKKLINQGQNNFLSCTSNNFGNGMYIIHIFTVFYSAYARKFHGK